MAKPKIKTKPRTAPPSPQSVLVIAYDFYCDECAKTATVTCMSDHHVRTK